MRPFFIEAKLGQANILLLESVSKRRRLIRYRSSASSSHVLDPLFFSLSRFVPPTLRDRMEVVTQQNEPAFLRLHISALFFRWRDNNSVLIEYFGSNLSKMEAISPEIIGKNKKNACPVVKLHSFLYNVFGYFTLIDIKVENWSLKFSKSRIIVKSAMYVKNSGYSQAEWSLSAINVFIALS